MNTETAEKPSRIWLAAVLTVLIFAVASLGAIMLIETQKIHTLENDTAWLETMFAKRQSQELTKQQKDIIHNSVGIISNVAQDEGVTVTLQSVCGNEFYTYYKIDVELPEEINAGAGYSFEDIYDAKAGLGGYGCGADTLEDGDPNDNRYSLLLTTKLGYDPYCSYSFDSNIVRTLHLKNIQTIDDDGKDMTLIQGKWDFDLLFYDESKAVEVIQDPVKVVGFDYLWKESWYEATVTSFALTEFSAYCHYTKAETCEASVNLHPVVILKNGTTIRLSARSTGGSSTNYNSRYISSTPIPLNEVAFVILSDDVVLPMP